MHQINEPVIDSAEVRCIVAMWCVEQELKSIRDFLFGDEPCPCCGEHNCGKVHRCSECGEPIFVESGWRCPNKCGEKLQNIS